jgi:uncharacterized membrane protein
LSERLNSKYPNKIFYLNKQKKIKNAVDFSFENSKFLYSFKKYIFNVLNQKKFKIFLFLIYFSLILFLMKLKAKIQIGNTPLYDANLTVIRKHI